MEFFAGKAEATRMFRESHYRTARLDIIYMRPNRKGINPMDLCTDSGFSCLGPQWFIKLVFMLNGVSSMVVFFG